MSGAARPIVRRRPLTARTATLTIVAQIGGRAVTVAVVAASTAIVTRSISVGAFADWATVLSLVAMVSFALDPGLSPVIIRRLSQEPESVPSARALLAVRLIIALVALALICALTVSLRGMSAALIALVLGAQVVPRAAVLNAGTWLQSDHRLHRQTFLEALTAAAGFVALVVAAIRGSGPVVIAATGFLAPACVLAVLMQREGARTPSSSLLVPGPQRARLESVVRELAPLAGALLIMAVYARLNVVFVNIADDATGVARFLLAFQFVEQILVVSAIVAGTLLPLLAARARSQTLVADPDCHRLLVGAGTAGALGSALLIVLAAPLTRLIGGPRLSGASHDLTLLAPMATVVLVAFLLGYLFLALGQARRYLRINIAALAFCVVGHLVLTLHYGAAGAARVAWLTEGLVVALAFAPLWRSGRSGRAAGIRLAVLGAIVVAGCELDAAGALTPPVAAIAIAAGALLSGGRSLTWLVGLVRRGRVGGSQAPDNARS